MNQEEQNKKALEEQSKKMSQLIAKCWSEDSFKKKLLADPAAVLKAEGVKVELPAGMTLKVVENTDKVFHIVLPPKPTELSEEQLELVAGGASACWQQCGFCQGSITTPPPCSGCGCGTIQLSGGCASWGGTQAQKS
jgi:hypothetical protein